MSNKTTLAEVFTTFLQHQKLEDKKLLLMVSGGVDSAVLLHVAVQVVKPEYLAVLHVNHNTRNEAREDELFVQNLCSKLNIKFYNEILKPITGSGIETQWRTLRQELSAKTAKDFGAAIVLTAHHATDLVETMIFRLTKGCGPAGLSPFDTSTKPFWEIPKQALLDYAKAHQLEWKEDITNLNTKFKRNLIRAEVLPSLRSITPNLENVFVRESQTFLEIEEYLQNQAQLLLKDNKLSLDIFLACPPALQKTCLRSMATKIPSQAEIDDCLKWLTGNPAGNSKKQIGDTKLTLKAGVIIW